MRKFTIFLALMFFIGLQVAQAQRSISGRVTSSEDGTGIPGATVLVKGTTVGSITDVDGKYSLTVPKDKNVILVSYVGMKTQEITLGTDNEINVSLEPDVQELEGVVVTALGITREKKALGYSVQDVSGSELEKAREVNMINSLSGRVAGVQVTNGSGNMGGSSRILIRGINSISGNNQPLFVIDGIVIDNSDFNTVNTARGAGGVDYGNMAQDINTDDIENISVLKGANAAALYGSRAANGVIMITTKKGAQQKGKTIGISVNAGVMFEQVAILPEYQTKYGGGYTLDPVGNNDGYYKVPYVDGDGVEWTGFDLVPNYDIDESWGPAYTTTMGQYTQDYLNENYGITLPEGSPYAGSPLMYRKWNSWDSWDTEHYGKSEEWMTPVNDVETFFKTGVGWNNNISFYGGSEKANFRLSYTNLTSSGYMPNTQLDRNTVNFSGNAFLTDKFNVFANFNWVNNKAKGRPETGYGDNNVMQKFNQWGQRQLDMKELEAYINPDGTQRTWNRTSWDDPTPMYSDNPYWTRNMNYENDSRDRYYGNIGLSYQILPWLSATGKVNLDAYTFRVQERVAVGSQAQSSYSESIRQVAEINAEFLFQADKKFAEDWRINATFGGNIMNRNYNLNTSATSGGLLIPELYTLSNSASPAKTLDYKSRKKINSLYGGATLSFRSLAYLDVTLRNDWSSTLPEGNNSYMYPSFSLSFVFTELDFMKEAKWFSFGKIRGSWAKVGNDTDPYRTSLTYSNMLDPDGMPYQFYPYALYTLPTTLNNPNLKPEMTRSWEIGADLRFLNNRLGLDVTYYNKLSLDQILPVAISGASGYGSIVVNAGKISNKGIEAALKATPVKYKDKFAWDIIINWAKNDNEVLELYPGVDVYLLANGPFKVSVNAEVGEKYGALMGTDFIYDANGNKVVDQDGRYLQSGVTTIGNVLPDWNMGITNNFKVWGFDVGCLIDIQHGGDFFSTTHMWGIYSGILAQSAEGNMREEGVVIDGTVAAYDEDGNVIFNADGTAQVTGTNTTVLDAHTWATDHYDGPAAQNIFDASYIKLREVRVGYTFPKSLTGPIQNLRLAVYGRNLATWGTALKGIDPETLTNSGNVQGIEGAGLPSLRIYGINLSFNF